VPETQAASRSQGLFEVAAAGGSPPVRRGCDAAKPARAALATHARLLLNQHVVERRTGVTPEEAEKT